jgi:thiol-disulfide isomerase/thioredoxin
VAAALLAALATPVAGQAGVPALLRALGFTTSTRAPGPADLVARTLDGDRVSLAHLRGRVVLVTFWATWCPPCREEMVVFERMHRDLAPSGLEVLALNAYEEAGVVARYRSERALTLPLLLDPDGAILQAWGVVGLPTTVIIGRDGRPVGRAVGPRDWGGETAWRLIRALLAEPRGPSAP